MSDENIKIDMKSLNLSLQNRMKLQELFPEVFTESKIDFERLKQVLGETIETGKERYGMTWAGKSNCFKIIQEPSVGTLKPQQEESINFDNSNNLFIEGDNLEVLKLLQKSYYGKVKVIYIDPPYNTGNEFIYPDDFSESLDTYLRYTGQLDAEGKKFSTNTEITGRYHSKWMTMIYTRLYLARNLLREDGTIFISIDDNEVDNLKKICNEIFGEDNFQSMIIVQSNKRGQTYKDIAKTHEYILVYSKGSEPEIMEVDKADDALPFKDSQGSFDLWELRNRNPKFGRFNRPNLFYPIYVSPDMLDENGYSKVSLEKDKKYSVAAEPRNSEGEDGCWRWGKDKVSKSDLTSDTPVLVAKKKKDGTWNIYEKSRKSTSKVKTIWTETEMISEQGTMELGRLELAEFFDHPKPVELIKKCLKVSSKEDEVVLDFFAGSATTAQAVYELNAEDGGNRKFILVQLPEQNEEKLSAFKKGKNSSIADVSRERIRRVINRMQKEKTKIQDLGFKSFSLSKSNFKQWQGEIDKPLQEQLQLHVNHLDGNSSQNDILYEILLKSGFELTTQIEKQKIEKLQIYSIADGLMYIYLGNQIEKNVVDFVAEKKPSRFVCLDSSFAGNDQFKTNTVQLMKNRGIEFRTV